jgi:hypothetical protein
MNCRAKDSRPLISSLALLTFPFFLLLFSSNRALAQVPAAQVAQLKPVATVAVERNTALQLQKQQRVAHVASEGRVVLSERRGATSVRFTLRDFERGTSVTLPFEATHGPRERERYYLRVDGRYVLFTEGLSSQLSIFNTRTGQVRHVSHDGENIVGGSISSTTGDVLYQVREGLARNPRVFLLRKGEQTPTLVAEAMGGQWSPGGRFFTLVKRRPPQEREKTRKWDWWVYNKEAEPVLSLRRYGRSNEVEWAPTSDGLKLAFGALDEIGFYILHLASQGEDLDVTEARYIEPPEGWGFSGLHWSTDGSRLAFGAWAPGDETGEDSQLRVLTDRTYEQYVALPSAGAMSIGTPDWNWASPGALHVVLTEWGDVDGAPAVTARKLVRLRPRF